MSLAIARALLVSVVMTLAGLPGCTPRSAGDGGGGSLVEGGLVEGGLVEGGTGATSSGPARLAPIANVKPRNIVFIITDDQRYDAMGFLHSYLETPNIDAIAKSGAYFKNAVVTSSLCSPSRASIFTGRYAHNHRVVTNNDPIPKGTVLFPEYLKQRGYETAFFGKWHMGPTDSPQPGFDRWVSFPGQGVYMPEPGYTLNVDGQRVPQKGYITTELTDYALDWLEKRTGDAPFFAYVSHKAVHSPLTPEDRFKGRYANKPWTAPATMAPGDAAHRGRPMWVHNQRNSWHGVEFAYYGDLAIKDLYHTYLETLLSVDESVGRVLAFLRRRNLLDSTLVIYMGDNGFSFGEHGLIDKRTAYEESMRVPLVMQCPELFKGGQIVGEVVANIDLAPTILAAAGLVAPTSMDGRNALPLIAGAIGQGAPWREATLYEYYWEKNHPHTPTLFALRDKRYKYVRPYGVWDLDELYDLEQDPNEANNLAVDAKFAETRDRMKQRMFAMLEASDGMQIPLYADSGESTFLRDPKKSRAADFPRAFEATPAEVKARLEAEKHGQAEPPRP